MSTIRQVLAYVGFDVGGSAEGLSVAEQEHYRPKMALFFQGVGGGLDWGLTHLNRAHAECEVWQFTDAEADTLAVIYLKRAAHIGWLARVARQVEHIEDVNEVRQLGGIVGKRVAASGLFVASNGGLSWWLR